MAAIRVLTDRRLIIGLGAWVAYVVAFGPLYNRVGLIVAAMSVLPVIVTGWLFGMRLGLITGVVAYPLNAMLVAKVTGSPGDMMEPANLFAAPLVPLLGALFGRLRDVGEQAKQELAERKDAEEAVVASEVRYRGLFEGVPVGLYQTTEDGCFVDANPALVAMLGFPDRDSLLGLNAADLYVGTRSREKWQDQMSREGSVTDVELRLRRFDGEVIWVRDTARTVRDAKGDVLYYEGSLTDVTERKQAEERLQHYASALEQANEEVKQFAYIVSHDLRAPLVNLKGFAAELESATEIVGAAMAQTMPHLDEQQRQDVAPAVQEDIPEALEFINVSVANMDHFINALLKLSRLGRRELDLDTVDMEALVHGTLRTLGHQIEERRAEVTVGPLPEVVADRTSMEQIVGNLLGNAVKYLDPDRPGKIDFTAEPGSGVTAFQIRDNGLGIAEDDMDKVFVPFRRAGRQDMPGEGMGLPYVRALVRRHGGRIQCESELGEGTTFTFTISNDLSEGVDDA